MARVPDRFQDHPAMLLAGFRRRYGFAEAPVEIPREWERFMAALPLPGQIGEVTYGAVCSAGMAAGAFEYMPAVEVESFDGLSADHGRMHVPEARYAVFVHSGPIAAIRDTIGAAHGWLETNGEWKDGETPEFERYAADYDPATGRGVEIWVPVVPA